MAEEYYAIPEDAVQGIAFDDLPTFPVGINGERYFAVAKSNIEEFLSRLGFEFNKIQWKNTDFHGIYAAELDKRKKQNSKDPVAHQRARFVELCKKYKGARHIETLRSDIVSIQEKVQRYQQELMIKIRESEQKERMLRSLESDMLSSSMQFEKEFETICAHPDVEEILIGDPMLVVHTKPISIKYDKGTYLIGRFKISLCLNGEKSIVTMLNDDNRIRKGDNWYDHPHVKNEKPCLGNISKALPELIAEHRYFTAISVCIQFLKSYTKSDEYGPFLDIINWKSP